MTSPQQKVLTAVHLLADDQVSAVSAKRWHRYPGKSLLKK